MTPLRAFHGNPAIKATYLARVRAHREADELIHGTYWEDGKGCAVGCTIHGSDHSDYERKLGVPTILAYLEDRLFESLPAEAAQQWPAAFLEAIPVGADLSLVWPKFAVWLLTDPQDGVVRFAWGKGRHAITWVSELYQRMCAGQSVSLDEWTAARAAVYDAYASGNAAWAAAGGGGVATYAARKAAIEATRTARATGEATAGTDEEAAWAATGATRTAAYASLGASGNAGVDAARAAATKRQAEKLLELLRTA